MTTTSTYLVDGMTCGHCVSAVTAEIMALSSVVTVDVALVPEAVSTVTVVSEAPLGRAAVAEAIAEAGYGLRESKSPDDPESPT